MYSLTSMSADMHTLVDTLGERTTHRCLLGRPTLSGSRAGADKEKAPACALQGGWGSAKSKCTPPLQRDAKSALYMTCLDGLR